MESSHEKFIKHLWDCNKITVDEGQILTDWANTIEAQQQEIKTLNTIIGQQRDTIIGCNKAYKAQQQEIDQLQAQAARMRGTIALLNSMILGKENHSEQSHDMVKKALSANELDYHNPVDVEALESQRKYTSALEKQISVRDGIISQTIKTLKSARTALGTIVPKPERYPEQWELVSGVITEIDKVLGANNTSNTK